MKCDDIGKGLIAYLDRRASSADRRTVEEHLAGCAACRKRAEEYRKVWTVLDEVPSIEPSFAFNARVRERVAAEPRPQWFGWLVPQARVAFSMAMLLVLSVWLAKLPSTVPPGAANTAAIQQEDFNAIENLGVLENYDVVTKMDALSQLAPPVPLPADKPQDNGTSND
jgi:anti-sigma factor RsiW